MVKLSQVNYFRSYYYLPPLGLLRFTSGLIHTHTRTHTHSLHFTVAGPFRPALKTRDFCWNRSQNRRVSVDRVVDAHTPCGFSDCDPVAHARPQARPSSFLPSFDRCPFPGTIPVRGHVGRRDKRPFDRVVSPVDYSDLPAAALISFFVLDQKPQWHCSIVVITPRDDCYCYYVRGHERFAGHSATSFAPGHRKIVVFRLLPSHLPRPHHVRYDIIVRVSGKTAEKPPLAIGTGRSVAGSEEIRLFPFVSRRDVSTLSVRPSVGRRFFSPRLPQATYIVAKRQIRRTPTVTRPASTAL